MTPPFDEGRDTWKSRVQPLRSGKKNHESDVLFFNKCSWLRAFSRKGGNKGIPSSGFSDRPEVKSTDLDFNFLPLMMMVFNALSCLGWDRDNARGVRGYLCNI